MNDENDINSLGDEAMVNADEALYEAVETALEQQPDQGGMVASGLVHTIQSRYEECKRSRDTDEQRWLQAYQNYRGLYAKDVKFREEEKSRVFVKATKTKVIAAYGQLIDVLFGSNKFPISIRPTEVPEGSSEFVHYSAEGNTETGMMPSNGEEMMDMSGSIEDIGVGYKGDGREIPPGSTFEEITQGIRQELIDKVGKEKFKKGTANNGEPQFKPASEAAKRLEKLIHDQIAESDGSTELRNALFECALLGTGIIKGPFTLEKTLHKWEVNPETGERVYKPGKVKVPRIESCSIFDFFPDPNARTMAEAEFAIQRHKMSRSQIRALKDRPFFKKDQINAVLKESPNYVNSDYENEIMSENHQVYPSQDRYEVLEYWGVVDAKDLETYGLYNQIDKHDYTDEVQVNIWLCGSKILRVALNPFTPKRIPYLSFCYERNPYSFFGIGVAENMSDSQMIMNGHMRMAIDNLALAGNMVLDVDENALAPGQSYEIYPGKVFKRQGGSPGQAVYGIKFPNTAPENMQIFDKFRQIADESTGIPSYAHGQTGVMSTTRTASGMSMLMGAASLNVKTVVKNIDDFLLRPLGEAMFQWNMAFYEGDVEIVGDLEVKAGGAASLMQNEIKSQRLTAFAQLFSNPAVAPFIKIPAYIRSFVESLELDPDELINNPDEAKIQADIMGAAGGLQGQQGGGMPQQMGNPGDVPPPSMPGGEGFSANTGEMPPPEGEIQ